MPPLIRTCTAAFFLLPHLPVFCPSGPLTFGSSVVISVQTDRLGWFVSASLSNEETRYRPDKSFSVPRRRLTIVLQPQTVPQNGPQKNLSILCVTLCVGLYSARRTEAVSKSTVVRSIIVASGCTHYRQDDSVTRLTYGGSIIWPR